LHFTQFLGCQFSIDNLHIQSHPGSGKKSHIQVMQKVHAQIYKAKSISVCSCSGAVCRRSTSSKSLK